eukprot:FR738968.1.p1 GENE.FR738968.1~~FR738968.1.p1  ORF type:complete len:263 (+),score=15.51 FR738968.1:55-789(+)
MEVLVEEVKDFTFGQGSRLYTCFDVHGHGRIEFAIALGALLLLQGDAVTMQLEANTPKNHKDLFPKGKPTYSQLSPHPAKGTRRTLSFFRTGGDSNDRTIEYGPVERVAELWQFYDRYSPGRSDVQKLDRTMYSSCHSELSEKETALEIKTVLKPAFYRYLAQRGLMAGSGGASSGGGDAGGNSAVAAMAVTLAIEDTAPKAFGVTDLQVLLKSCPSTLAMVEANLQKGFMGRERILSFKSTGT